MKLQDYMDVSKLTKLVVDGYINQRKHPTLPLFIYNYSPSAQFDQHWPHEVCACRGLIVDSESNIISRPMYKFFNLGQPSTILGTLFDPHEINEDVMVDANFLGNLVHSNRDANGVTRTPLTFTRKMDGQMGILWNYDKQWGIATRGSFESEGALFATQKFQKFVKFGAAEDFIPKGWSLIFEIIAKHLRIVIPYEWEGLCLLTAVNIETGEEMSYEKLHELWVNLNSYSKTLDADGVLQPGKPWCRIVEKFDIDLETAKNDTSLEEEGYVASVYREGLPPVKVKIKLAEYCRLHKILTGVTPQMIWAEMADPMATWLQANCKYDRKTGETAFNLRVPAEFSAWVLQWQRGLMKAFHENLMVAIDAQADLRVWERFHAEHPFKNDVERKKWLQSQGFLPDIGTAALFLRSGKIVEAYNILWKLVRPHGRDDKFYVEGKGE
jgi:RNA ligase